MTLSESINAFETIILFFLQNKQMDCAKNFGDLLESIPGCRKFMCLMLLFEKR